MSKNTAEILNMGMECLIDNLGDIETERFLSTFMRERFDYTKWQREYFDNMNADEFHEQAVNYAKSHPSW